MTRKWISATIFSVLICLTPFSAPAASNVKFRVLAEQLPPLSYLDTNTNQAAGVCIDVVRTLLDSQSIDYTVEILPWGRAMQIGLNNPNVIVLPMGRIPERESKFQWLKKIDSINYQLYALSTKKKLFESPLSDARTKRIGVTFDDVNHIYLRSQGFNNLQFVNNYPQLFELLKKGRVDYIASNDFGVKIVKNSLEDVYVPVSPYKDFSVDEVGIYFALSNKTSLKLTKTLFDGFKKMEESGTYKELMSPLFKLLR